MCRRLSSVAAYGIEIVEYVVARLAGHECNKFRKKNPFALSRL